jgi:GTP-binding protein
VKSQKKGPSGGKNEGEPRIVRADFVAGATDKKSLPAPAMAEIAFAGRSNVGKSSLMNALMQRKSLVRTSNTPGRTREINIFAARLSDGFEVHLVDLPGYGYAKISKAAKRTWGPMLEDYLTSRPTLRAVVLIVDVRRGVEQDDRDLVEFVREGCTAERNKPLSVIVVATKMDKIALSKQKPSVLAIKRALGGSGLPVLGFSAETGAGREELWAWLRHQI